MSDENTQQTILRQLAQISERLKSVEILVGLRSNEPAATAMPPSPPPPASPVKPDLPRTVSSTIPSTQSPTNSSAMNGPGVYGLANEGLVRTLKENQKRASGASFVSESESAPSDSSLHSTGSFIGMIGIVCFILGAVLIVKMAITAGWLTPMRQWGLVALFGAALGAVGLRLRESDSEYAGSLVGAGVVVLYFAAYSGALIFGVYDSMVALGMVTLLSALSLWLLKLFASDFFSLTAVTGIYFAPILLGYQTTSFEAVSGFFVVWTFVFAIFSAYLSSRALALLATYFAIGVYATINLHAPYDQIPTIIVVQALQFLFLLGGVVFYSLKYDQPMEKGEVWLFFPALLFFYATEYYFLAELSATFAPWISLVFALLLVMAHRFAASRLSQGENLESGEVIWAFVAVVLFHSVYLKILPDFVHPYLVMIAILGYCFFRKEERSTSGSAPFALMLGLICVKELATMCLDLLSNRADMIIFPAVGAVLALYFMYGSVVRPNYSPYTNLFLTVIHLLAMLNIYHIVQDGGSFALSLSWGLYAGVILFFSYAYKDWVLMKSSVVILLIAAVKALLWDAAKAPTEVRVMCLLLTGAMLYGTGYLFRRISDLEQRG